MRPSSHYLGRLPARRHKYDEMEKILAGMPQIAVPTITLEGDANGAPHPEPATYRKKFVGRYEHRTLSGGSGTICRKRRPRISRRQSSILPGRSHDVSVTYRTVDVDGLPIFYREAGDVSAPVILLLHGLPSSSRMFDPLLVRLADRFRLIAPDYPGVSDIVPPRHRPSSHIHSIIWPR